MTSESSSPVRDLNGAFAAVVTPIDAGSQPDLAALPALLDFLVKRGCHGVLVLGTTGEGPAFSVREREAVIREAARHRAAAHPDLKLLAGTGAASLADAIELTRLAFDLGVDGAVVLPGFYFKGVSPAGISTYFEQIVRSAVPSDGRLLVYHIPQTSGVGIPAESIASLRQRFPRQVWGMKDSQDDLPHTLAMLAQFPGFGVFVGSDSIMAEGLAAGSVGAITALANVTAPLNRAVWDAHQAGRTAPEAQARLVRARQAVKGLNGPAAMKCALADLFGFPLWGVRPPLELLAPEARRKLCAELEALLDFSS